MKTVPNRSFFEVVESLIEQGQPVELRMRGGSMRPYLRGDRDVAVLEPVAPEQLKKGDVVLFRYRGAHLLHRIAAIDGDRLSLLGDGALNGEQAVRSDVVARLVRVIRPSGRTESATSAGVRLYTGVWRGLRPLRRYLLAVYDRTLARL